MNLYIIHYDGEPDSDTYDHIIATDIKDAIATFYEYHRHTVSLGSITRVLQYGGCVFSEAVKAKIRERV